jgi:natural product biosynthesis luciferase-like monooxygenase protein
MEFSLFYWADDHGAPGPSKYRLVLEGARWADEHGFAAVWIPERHFHAFGGQYPNPAVVGAAVATATSRIQIRAGSVVLPLHDPIRVAEEWSVVDNLSSGRAAIAFASGWAANDFVLAPHRYRDRHAVMYRDIETVRRLWRGESISAPNGEGVPTEVTVRPRPVQADLPVWVTAAGSMRTFESAGEIGANVLTHLLGHRWDQLREKITAYRNARRRAGHPGPGRVSLMVHTFLHADADYVARIARPPLASYIHSSLSLLKHNLRRDAAAEDVQALVELSAEKYFRTFGLFGPPSACLPRVRLMADIGVDDVACLIDFGIDADAVLASLPYAKELADLAARGDRGEAPPADTARANSAAWS